MPQHGAHRLIEVDRETMTGVCLTCGPTRLKKRTRASRGGRVYYECRRPESRGKGWTKEEWALRESMRSAQGGLCAICGDVLDGAGHTDHCHEKGHIRGVLCRGCNLGLGYFRDRAEALRAAAEYLEAH